MASSKIEERREPLVDWDAVDAMFRYVESPHCRERQLNGFALSGFVAAAVMVDATGETDVPWREVFGRSPAGVPAQVRKGFVENWLDVEAKFGRGRFAPVVSGPDEHDHVRTVADFCAGFVRALDARPHALALLNERPTARDAVTTLRHFAVAFAEPAPRAHDTTAAVRIAEALRALWSAAANLRARLPDAAPLRAA